MHIVADRKALLSRTDRLLGQVGAIRRIIEEGRDKECYSVLHLMTSARGALDGLIRLYLEGHIRDHVVSVPKEAKRSEAGEQLILALRAFLR